MQEFNGRKYYENRDGYYSCHHPNGLIHRHIWASFNGDIPDGHVIHHKNHDRADNDIDNLECMSWSKHASLHAKKNKYYGSDENKAHLDRIRKYTWKKKKRVPAKCTHCGSDYTTLQPERTKFCSKSCKSIVGGREYRKRQRDKKLASILD